MKVLAPLLLIPCAILAACGRTQPPPSSAASTPAPAQTVPVPAANTPSTSAPAQATSTVSAGGFATLSAATGKPGGVNGSLQLAGFPDRVEITGQVTGLAPNTTHGFHIHQTGDCSAPDLTSAGEHFNPDGAMHGAPTSAAHHLGDIASIKSDGKGTATIRATIKGATLNDGGPHDLVGKAFIVHAKPDDYKNPTLWQFR